MSPQNSGSGQTPDLHDQLSSGVDSVGFRWDDVEDKLGVFIESIPAAKLSREQARHVFAFLKREIDSAKQRDEAELVMRVLAELIASPNLGLDVRAFAMAAGLGDAAGFSNQAELARSLRCSPALVSRAVLRWSDLLSNPTQKYRRTDETRKNCSNAQSANHWRSRNAGNNPKRPDGV